MFYTKELKDRMRGLELSKGALEKTNKTLEERNKELYDDNAKLRKIETEIEENYKKKEEHAVALLKIEQEREIHKQVSKVKDEYNAKEKELVEKHFGKLTKSLDDLHSKGNANTQFVEKVSLKMMDVMAQLSGKKLDTQGLLSAPSIEEEGEVEYELVCECNTEECCEICEPEEE